MASEPINKHRAQQFHTYVEEDQAWAICDANSLLVSVNDQLLLAVSVVRGVCCYILPARVYLPAFWARVLKAITTVNSRAPSDFEQNTLLQ